MNKIFSIKGGKKLKGEIEVSGSKNATLPILASTLAVAGESIIKNLPNISDVQLFLDIMRSFGAKITEINSKTIKIDTNSVQNVQNVEHHGIEIMRGSILLLGPLLSRFGEVKMPFPGGCVLGKRSADTHLSAFEQIGAEIIESEEYLHLKLTKNFPKTKEIVLPEMSVTATENILILLATINQETELRLTASEPHVQNLCEALISAGAKIDGIGTHNLRIKGSKLKNMEISITPDMLEAGTLILASALTNGDVIVHGAVRSHLDSFYQKLKEVGVNFDILSKNSVHIKPRKQDFKATKIQTAIFPSFPTDLQSPFAVLLTQAQGVSRIFETLFEGRFAFLFELEKMGAHVEILNPHEAIIIGKTPLKGVMVASQDIRAGAAMILAGLCAEGTTEISNINYILRGYEDIDKKLRSLGAEIELK